MNPKIIKKEAMLLVGMATYGEVGGAEWSEGNNIGKLWMRFMKYWEKYYGSLDIKPVDTATIYELSLWNKEELKEQKVFSTFVGIEVESFENVPYELECKILPASTYAFFSVKGEYIKKWYNDFYEDWLKKSPYEIPVSGGYSYEMVAYVHDKFFGLDEDNIQKTELDVYVPLKE